MMKEPKEEFYFVEGRDFPKPITVCRDSVGELFLLASKNW